MVELKYGALFAEVEIAVMRNPIRARIVEIAGNAPALRC